MDVSLREFARLRLTDIDTYLVGLFKSRSKWRALFCHECKVSTYNMRKFEEQHLDGKTGRRPKVGDLIPLKLVSKLESFAKDRGWTAKHVVTRPTIGNTRRRCFERPPESSITKSVTRPRLSVAVDLDETDATFFDQLVKIATEGTIDIMSNRGIDGPETSGSSEGESQQSPTPPQDLGTQMAASLDAALGRTSGRPDEAQDTAG